MDYDKNGTIEYKEFVACSLTKRIHVTRTNALALFEDIIETRDSDTIDSKAISIYFRKNGKMVEESKLKKEMNDCSKIIQIKGFDGDSKITFETFYKFLITSISN